MVTGGAIAGDLGDWQRAAALHGAAQALLDQTEVSWEQFDARRRQDSLDQTEVSWEQFDARRRQDSLDQIAAALGADHLRQAHAYGMTLSLNQAIDLAVEKHEPS